jgi:hypothetical protein
VSQLGQAATPIFWGACRRCPTAVRFRALPQVNKGDADHGTIFGRRGRTCSGDSRLRQPARHGKKRWMAGPSSAKGIWSCINTTANN